MPAAVLAESVLTGHAGHDFHVWRLLDVVNITDVDASTGHAAGALRLASMGAGMTAGPEGLPKAFDRGGWRWSRDAIYQGFPGF